MPITADTTLITSAEAFEDSLTPDTGSGGLKASLDALQARLAIPARYEVIEELGRGGMGIVYRVRDIETCEIVAIKILKPEIAADPAMRESLRKEVCLARKVTHKNVCRIYEFTRSETTACISMEYIPGESLLSKLQRRGALSVAHAVEIARQICSGLREAHAQGIVHRDLKPANIVIAPDKTVKIMDFGVARKFGDASPTTELLAGTPAYMSPEQLEMGAITERTDVYALGLILYEMVTGASAFSGENAVAIALQQIRQTPPRPSSVVPAIPARLDSAILKCLEKDPSKRFASVEELSAALEKAIAPVIAPAKEPVEYKYFQAANVTFHTVRRAALSDLKLLRIELEQGLRKLQETARPRADKWLATLRSHFERARSTRQAQAAVFGATLLAAAAVFGLVMHGETHAEPKAAPVHSPTVSSFVPVKPVDLEPPSPFSAHEFDFDAVPSDSPAPPAVALSIDVPAEPTPAQASAVTASRALRASVARPLKISLPQHSVATAPQSNSPSVVVSAAPPSLLAEIPLDEPRPAGALVAPQPPAHASPPQAQAAQPATPLHDEYLEVGSFNDPTWANDAVNRLSQLGFHAVIVHKAVLWVQSYHVEVGPFETLNSLETAEQRLETKGFKSHSVK